MSFFKEGIGGKKKQKMHSKEAFDGTAFAFFFDLSEWQTRTIFLAGGIPQEDGKRSQHHMDLHDKA